MPDDSEEEIKPKKSETKKTKKTTAERKAPLEPSAEPPPKAKTGKVAKPAAKAEDAPAAEEKPKTATGKTKKLGAGAKGGASAAGKRPRPAGPPPAPPAVRGPLDYALGVIAPLAGAGLGALGFLAIKTGVGYCSNPILAESIVNPAQEIPKGLELGWAVAFPPAPIIVGAVVGLLATACFLKMAAGLAARLMGGGMLAFGILATLPFLFAGNSLQGYVKSKLKKEYAVPRGQDVDPRTLSFSAPDFAQRRFLSAWKVDLDEGDLPVSWIAASEDPGLPTGKDVPEDEAKIKNADLRIALIKARELAAQKKIDDAIWTKLQALRDAANKEIDSPSEQTDTLKTNWAKFEGLCKGKLAKPPAPKNAPWFDKFTVFGEFGQTGSTQDDRAFYQKYYFGKAMHKAVKDLPADMRFVGCFRADVKEDAPIEGVSRYPFAWVCYDLEKPDRDPVVVPHIKGVLDEARFKIEVLGEK